MPERLLPIFVANAARKILRRQPEALPVEPLSIIHEELSPVDLEEGASEEYVRRFRLPAEIRAGLNGNQLRLLELFDNCGEGISDLFLLQKGKGETPNFYPPRVTKRQILRAAKNNSEIIAPDSVVRRNQDGTFEPISMYVAYARAIRRTGIVSKLKEAQTEAVRDGNIPMATYLGVKATSLENGDAQLAHQAWMEIENEPPVDLALGLYDTVTDPFGFKESFEAWATALDKKLTAESQPFADAYLKWWATDTGEKPPRVKIRVGYPTFIAGQAYREDWTANNLGRPEWRQKYGSKFTFFETIFQTNFREKILPDFFEYIDPNRRIGIHEDLVERASRRKLIAHELAHSLDIPSTLNSTFNEYASPLKELYCDLVSLDGYFNIADPTLIEPREQEMALATFLSNGVSDYQAYKSTGKRRDYYFSTSLILTRLIERNAVQIDMASRRITWINPRLAYPLSSELRHEVHNLIHHGSFKKAKEYIASNLDPEVYKPLATKENYGFFTFERKVQNPDNVTNGQTKSPMVLS